MAGNGKWMQKAFSKNKGKLHRALGVAQGKKIPTSKLNAAYRKAKKSGNTKRMREINLARLGRRFGGH